MPKGVVSQIHRLARRSNANNKLTFTNNVKKNLDTLYANLEHDKDKYKLEQQEAQPIATGGGEW